MKNSIFHFFGNLLEQSALPTRIKFAIAFKLELLLFLLSQFKFRYVRTPAEERMSEDFMKYIYTNQIEENARILHTLKKGLDTASITLIDNIIARQKHIYTHNLVDVRLFTAQERLDQKLNTYAIKKKYHGLTNFYGVENFYFHCGLRHVPKNVLKKYKGKDVIDAGAANGDTPAIFSREYDFGTIYAFEPEKNNYDQMLQNIKRFHLTNVVPVPEGVGDKKIKMRITSEGGQSHITTDGNQQITITTIDEFVEKNKVTVGLLKMDIEGFEYYALQGAQKTIKKFHPLLLISIYHSGKDFFEIKPQVEKLGKYKFIIRKLNPHHLFFDTMLIGIPI
jgi:FkbM family methyltransferase